MLYFSSALLLLVMLVIITSWLDWWLKLALAAVLLALLYKNLRTISYNRKTMLVLNASAEFNVLIENHVYPAELVSYWLYPNWLMISFKFEQRRLYLMMFRRIISPEVFSKLVVAIQKQNETEL